MFTAGTHQGRASRHRSAARIKDIAGSEYYWIAVGINAIAAHDQNPAVLEEHRCGVLPRGRHGGGKVERLGVGIEDFHAVAGAARALSAGQEYTSILQHRGGCTSPRLAHGR